MVTLASAALACLPVGVQVALMVRSTVPALLWRACSSLLSA
ncbi:hypothetical protein [Reyranella sp.]